RARVDEGAADVAHADRAAAALGARALAGAAALPRRARELARAAVVAGVLRIDVLDRVGLLLRGADHVLDPVVRVRHSAARRLADPELVGHDDRNAVPDPAPHRRVPRLSLRPVDPAVFPGRGRLSHRLLDAHVADHVLRDA